MTDAKLSLALLARIAEFLQELPEADVADFAEGRAKLALVFAADTRPAKPAIRFPAKPLAKPTTKSTLDLAQVRATLAAMSSRDEGAAYLAPLSAKDLKALAGELEMRGISSLKKVDLAARIVEQTIGFRLNSIAIRKL